MLKQAEQRLAAAGAPAHTPPVVDPPPMKPEWEKEVDDRLSAGNGSMEIPLPSGQKMQVVPDGHSFGSFMMDKPEVDTTTFKRLIRCAAILGGKVTRIVPKEFHTAELKAIIEQGKGYWASPCVFVEVEKKESAQSAPSTPSDGIVASPGNPEALPVLDPRPFLSISAGIVKESVPMRLPNGKVMGSLLKTVHGPLYVKNAGEADHRLHVGAEWANLGGYTIDEEIFRKYLGDPQTVIKVVRDKVLYFTTSEHVKRYAGVIRSWGAEKLVMPLSGKFWLVTNEQGQSQEFGS